jgi:hypothetical protein
MFTPSDVVFSFPCNTAIAWFSEIAPETLIFECKMYDAIFFLSDFPDEGVLLFKLEKRYVPMFMGDSYDLQRNWQNYEDASFSSIELEFNSRPKITHTSSVSYVAHTDSFYNFPAEVLNIYCRFLGIKSMSELLRSSDSYPVPKIYRRVVLNEKTYHIFSGEDVEGYIVDEEIHRSEPGNYCQWESNALYCALLKD